MEINSINMTGNLCADPELNYTPSGKAICKLRIASTDQYTDQNHTKQDKTVFVDVDIWGPAGENCARWLSKGDQIAFTGRLDQDLWQAQDGSKRSKHKITASLVKFLRTKKHGDVNGNVAEPDGNRAEEYEDDEPF